ncbi:unnamed protein product [Calicophoron daubneyi]|uniref:Hypoxanthine phosphoribosyltransferase n=1 Tax=Calicophoron daubneyi TaxID=300641 RepID=A0AAV2T6I1_CALDB
MLSAEEMPEVADGHNAMQKDTCQNAIVLRDDYTGFPVQQFCIPPLYDNYIEKILIPNGLIKDRIEKMALDIITSFENNKATSLTLLCVLKGGFKFLADLIDGLESAIRARGTIMPIRVDFARVKTYVNDKSVHEPVLTGLEDPSLYKDRDILIVEDIIDTGRTMKHLLKHLTVLSPRSIQVASLLVKRTPLSSGFRPEFCGFEIPDHFVVGYAFDYNDNFRDMHHICVINEAGRKKFSLPFG